VWRHASIPRIRREPIDVPIDVPTSNIPAGPFGMRLVAERAACEPAPIDRALPVGRRAWRIGYDGM